MPLLKNTKVSVLYTKSRLMVSRNITVDHLGHPNVARLSHEIEGLGFDAGAIHSNPFQVLLFQLRPWCSFCLFGDRSDRRRSVDRLLGASNVCYSVQVRKLWHL